MRYILNDSKYHFKTAFDTKTGFYVRSGIVENGKDTGVDPFMASFPHLIDVGIMGHCIHGKTGLCLSAGIECYQSGNSICKPNMSLENFEKIASECKHKTIQFALGGRGDPDQHEQFEEILKTCAKHEIIPNFTTSGYGMTPEIAKLCKKYCGAVAVSWYRSEYTLKAIHYLQNEGVKTNIHYVVSNNTIDELIKRLEENDFPAGINAVILLLHKPAGLGSKENMLSVKDQRVKKLFNLIDKKAFPFKVGMDSCTIPAVINFCENINHKSLDTCEGGRFSCYISADMKMVPCSFDQNERFAVDISDKSILEAWNSREFDLFRKHFLISCPECPNKKECMGGCPLMPEITLCNKKEKQNKILEDVSITHD